MRKFLLTVGLIGLMMSRVVLADNYAVIIQGSSPSKGMLPPGVEAIYSNPFMRAVTEVYGSECFKDEFWQDPLLLVQALEKAGIPRENMRVLWGNGTQWGYDDTTYQPRYRVPYVDMDASRESLDSVCAELAEILTNQDILFIYTFDHGFENSLYLYGSDISDTAFARLFDQIPYKYRWIGMQQCVSGSFIDALKNERTVMMTSTDSWHSARRADDILVPGDSIIEGSENEIYEGRVYNHGEWNTHLLTGFWGGLIPSLYFPDPIFRDSIDTDANGEIALAEIQRWILKRDSWYAAGCEFPQLSDLGNLASRFYVWPEIKIEGTGVEEGQVKPEQLVRVYPNPSNGLVNFISCAKSTLIYKIYNSAGQLIKETTESQIKINVAGIYFWKAEKNNKEIQQGKLIILK